MGKNCFGKDPTAQITSNLIKALKIHAQIYLNILKDMYVRYDENCQTLPKKIIRDEVPLQLEKLPDLKIDNNIKIFITRTESSST